MHNESHRYDVGRKRMWLLEADVAGRKIKSELLAHELLAAVNEIARLQHELEQARLTAVTGAAPALAATALDRLGKRLSSGYTRAALAVSEDGRPCHPRSHDAAAWNLSAALHLAIEDTLQAVPLQTKHVMGLYRELYERCRGFLLNGSASDLLELEELEGFDPVSAVAFAYQEAVKAQVQFEAQPVQLQVVS